MKRILIALFMGLVVQSTVYAQVGKGLKIWTWTQPAEHHKTVCMVNSSGGSGTGVLIEVDKTNPVADGFTAYVLTAWHVVQDDITNPKLSVMYYNGRKARDCHVMEYDEDKDVALLLVWVPSGIEPAKLATADVGCDTTIEFCGLGGGSEVTCCIRTFSGTTSPPTDKNKLFADVPLLPGDSGGPVFNDQHELIGIISGGWFWYDSDVKTASGLPIKTTWPARASNVTPLRTLIQKFRAK